ncbi:MAG: sigma-54-dependent Fis family transcriptional regulator [Gammaproteobacteria bacterium]|nr:MAG: sigma-54-dependent Fis family transcriptional regulator [Gammaproteobacteria bacterium]
MKPEATRILIIDGDSAQAATHTGLLHRAGHEPRLASDAGQAVRLLEREHFDLLLWNADQPPSDLEQTLPGLRHAAGDAPLIVMRAEAGIEEAVAAMRLGAADFVTLPAAADYLLKLVEHHLQGRGMQFVAAAPATLALLDMARRVAASDATALVTGESGTGKEVLARYLHRHSPRARGPFVAVNCAAIPENMLEALLFGHEKGAFTGAHEARPGKFELANGGTLLLDEISEMDLGLQAKLLRVLQEQEVERLGARRAQPLDVRVIATSNRDLAACVREGTFRQDLYYRLNVLPLHLPPLRERPEDIIPLAEYFLQRHGGGGITLTPAACRCLLAHDWPGNARELENLIQRALILGNGERIDQADLVFDQAPPAGQVDRGEPENAAEAAQPLLRRRLHNSESELILNALRANNGNRKRTAEQLGISPRTLRYKLARMRDAGMSIPA